MQVKHCEGLTTLELTLPGCGGSIPHPQDCVKESSAACLLPQHNIDQEFGKDGLSRGSRGHCLHLEECDCSYPAPEELHWGLQRGFMSLISD